MAIESFVEWLKRQGHRVVSTDSSYWYEVGPRIYQAIPYHRIITPSREELRGLLLNQRAIGLRYSTPLDSPDGQLSYHVINANKSYDLAQLPRKARYDVHKGLEYAALEPISFSRLASEGWALRQDTLKRQHRLDAETEEWWQSLCRSADGLPGFETWGAIHDGQLVACLLACTIDDCCNVLYQQSLTDSLKHCANNALTYGFTKEVIARPDVTRLFYGLDSLDAAESVDKFKFRMNYVAQPVRQRVVFHPWVRWLFNGMSLAVLRTAMCRWPAQSTISKAEGMVRFYLEGRKSLAEQPWPDCLTKQKERLLSQLRVSTQADFIADAFPSLQKSGACPH